MSVNLRWILAFVFAALIADPRIVHGECVILTAQTIMADTTIQLVFSGTVAEVVRTADAAYRAVFDVDHVWKGTVPKRFDLYVWGNSVGNAALQRGTTLCGARAQDHE